jgi:hypothetical protein
MKTRHILTMAFHITAGHTHILIKPAKRYESQPAKYTRSIRTLRHIEAMPSRPRPFSDEVRGEKNYICVLRHIARSDTNIT